ncbi:MAG TPA: DegV family protein [Candidatus Blautia gallistercoris]|uniref:DegV family protein n=1 Tax=Candidatus Blautia gallistercoris TaxID=2838490 RepID=A0A9D1WG82_9FIRM|nr:DegV family protein [Candidatus Blautia gallistercoris]
MSTAVMTDTNSGMTKEEASDLGIFLLPMPIIIEDQIYYEGENLSSSEFYEFLISGKKVTTSQPSPGDVIAMWDHIFSQGYDDLVFIPMSSGLSNTCQTAISLAADYEGRVQVIDNHRISVPMWESIINALQLAGDGADAKTIKKILEEDAYQNSIYIIVDTLEYLKKGGRITPAAAAFGSVLNIKPILSIQGSKLDAYAKVRGLRKGKAQMIAALEKDLNTRFAGIPKEKLHLATAGSCLSDLEAENWRQTVSEAFPQYAPAVYRPLSFSICCHTGPGAYGIGVTALR